MPGQRNYSARLIIRQSRFTGVEFARAFGRCFIFHETGDYARATTPGSHTDPLEFDFWSSSYVRTVAILSLSLSLSLFLAHARVFSLSLSPTPSPLCSPSCPSEYTLCRVCVYSSAFGCVVASTASPRSMYTSIPSCCSLPPRWIYEVKASG